jgi:hypothetical protein
MLPSRHRVVHIMGNPGVARAGPQQVSQRFQRGARRTIARWFHPIQFHSPECRRSHWDWYKISVRPWSQAVTALANELM